jgi:PAS domain S-box-containing protein
LVPYGACLQWTPQLCWLHALANGLIGVACYAIALCLALLLVKRRDLAVGWMLRLFSAFILACGTAQFADFWVLWHADYAAQGIIKLMTAGFALTTAVLLWPLVLRMRALPTPAQIRAVSAELARGNAERLRAIASLERSELSFRALVEGVTDYAIFLLDPAGRVSTWNAGARRIKGYTEKEIIGLHFSTFYTPEDRAAGLPERALGIAAEHGKFATEGWRMRKDGARFWAGVVLEALRNPDGDLIGFAKVTRDLTERRRAAEALEQTRAALAHAQKMETVGQLIGGVAHDFNNLLTAMLGGADLLQRRVRGLDANTARILEGIIDAGQRGAALVQRLLAFSRKQALSPRVTDVNRLITDMSELLDRTLAERVEVETLLDPSLWRCFVDRNQLENVLLNLAINARDAMPEGGRLRLQTANVVLDEAYAASVRDAEPGSYVVISVADTGVGMTEQVMERAFEPFFTTKPEGLGTGLGLSQVYGFITQSGGHVRLFSEVGRGTTVKLYLPRTGADVVALPPPSPPSEHVPAGHETILMVEDHADVRAFAASALGELGYRVLVADGAERGLTLLEAHPEIALLFTDLGLPGTDGRLLAEEARRRRPDLPVLFATGYARDSVAHHGFLESGELLLPKPYTIDVLARRLRVVLDRSRKVLVP